MILAYFEFIGPSQWLLVAAFALLTWTIVRRARITRQRALEHKTFLANLRQGNPGGSPEVHAQKQSSELQVQLHDLFREMNARLDTKLHVLNELLFDADQKIAQLRCLQRELTGLITQARALEPGGLPSAAPVAPTAECEPTTTTKRPATRTAANLDSPIEEEAGPLVIEPDRPAPCARNRPGIRGDAPSQPPPAEDAQVQADVIEEASPPPATAEAIPNAQRFAEIYRLADAGYSSGAISERTGMSPGEIELILGLRRRRAQIEKARRCQADSNPHA